MFWGLGWSLSADEIQNRFFADHPCFISAAPRQTEAQTVTINSPNVDPLYAQALYFDVSYSPSTSAQPYHEISARPATYGSSFSYLDNEGGGLGGSEMSIFSDNFPAANPTTITSVSASIAQDSGFTGPGGNNSIEIKYYFMVLNLTGATTPVKVDFEASLNVSLIPSFEAGIAEASFQILSPNDLVSTNIEITYNGDISSLSANPMGTGFVTPGQLCTVLMSANVSLNASPDGGYSGQASVDPSLAVDPSYAASNVIVYTPGMFSMDFPPPSIAGFTLSGTNLVLDVANGASGGTYITVASTNLALPLSQWTPVCTNLLIGSGNFTLTATNAVATKDVQQFYAIRVQ